MFLRVLDPEEEGPRFPFYFIRSFDRGIEKRFPPSFEKEKCDPFPSHDSLRRESRIIVFLLRSTEDEGRGDASLLTVLFQSFARFSTPTGGQPLDSAGETWGGHRDKTSGNWRNSAVILPVMFYPPHTYTLSRAFVGATAPPSVPSPLCTCTIPPRVPPPPPLLLSPNMPALSAAFCVRGGRCMRAPPRGRRRKVLRDIAPPIRPSFRELNFSGSRATFALATPSFLPSFLAYSPHVYFRTILSTRIEATFFLSLPPSFLLDQTFIS